MEDRSRPDEQDIRLLRRVANAAHLEEGGEGVRTILKTVSAGQGLSVRRLAGKCLIAAPAVAAVCGELRKRNILTPKGKGVRLTESGDKFVHDILGCVSAARVEIEEALEEALADFKLWAEQRPEPDVTLDQSKALPESVLRRTLYAYSDDGIEGRSICLLGDDDLGSVAIALVHRMIGAGEWTVRRLAVIEKDTRILDLIRRASEEIGVPIETIHADLARPLPSELDGRFDVVMTDPPYTVPGAALFLSRAAGLLESGPLHRCYLSFGHKGPAEDLELLKVIADLGMFPAEIRPGFNSYEGAGIIGSASRLISLRTTANTAPVIAGSYGGPFYTGESKRSRPR